MQCKEILGNYQGMGRTMMSPVSLLMLGLAAMIETGTGVVIDEPVGACCKSDVCSEKTAAECAASGLWGGAGTSCDDADICRRVVGSGTTQQWWF